MTITINGSGTITGITAGGLPDATIQQADLAANVAGNGPAFSAWTSGGQIISSGVAAKMAFNTEFFDTNSNFNNTSSTVDSTPAYAFLPTVAGYYHISTAITNTGSAVGILAVLLYKNGAQYLNTQVGNNTQGIGVPMSMLVYLNGTTDYVEIWVYQTTGGNVTTLSGRSDCYQFSGALVRAA
jgi:hypothetical protein